MHLHHHHLLSLTILLLFPHMYISSFPDEDALIKLKSSLNHHGALDVWSPGTSPCESRWLGVVCSAGAVSSIHLSSLSLSGPIDIDALHTLSSLRTITLSNNSFVGPIPAFNKLGPLKSLILSANKFSGEIPNDYFSPMASLKKVWLDNNNFSGNVPDSVMALPHLMELHLEGNRFSGRIPDVKDPGVLVSLDLSQNQLEGSVPFSLRKFNASSFVGNDGLCGDPLAIACPSSSAPTVAQDDDDPAMESPEESHPQAAAGGVGLVILVMVIIVTVLSSRKKDQR
ncbi:Pollen receptor-like kinase 3 [Linum grandiflorum]